MSNTHGGRREGAGRKRGTLNKATVEREIRAEKGLEAARLDGLLPLDVMLCRMKHEPLPNGCLVTDDQFAAAVAAAPYIHAKLSAAVIKGEINVGAGEALPFDPENVPIEKLAEFLHIWDDMVGVAPLMIEASEQDP